MALAGRLVAVLERGDREQSLRVDAPDRWQAYALSYKILVPYNRPFALFVELTVYPPYFQLFWRGVFPCCGAIAAPWILVGGRDPTRSNWVEDHVTSQLQQVAVFLNENSLEPALKHMPYPPVSAIEVLCVNTIELAHTFREVGFRYFDDHVIVVIHQAIRMAPPVKAAAYLPEHAQPLESVFIVIINRLTPIAS